MCSKFGNTVPEDLWRHFSDILRQVKHPLGAKNLTEIMSTWTDQPGFPLITFSYNKDGHITIQQVLLPKTRRYNRIVRKRMVYFSYLVQQRRFLYNSTEESSLQWYVPITYTTYDKKDFENTKPKTWLKPNEVQKLDEQLADREKWIIGNIQSSGKYNNIKILEFPLNTGRNTFRLLSRQLRRYSLGRPPQSTDERRLQRD